MEKRMVKGLSLSLMEISMWGNSRMIKEMVKEHTLSLVEISMLENTKMVKYGTENTTSKTETSKER